MLKNKSKIREDLFEIEISPDKLSAFVVIKDFSKPPNQLAVELKQFLARNNIRYGFVLESIKRLLKEQNPHLKLPVAKGTPPFPGRDSNVEFVIRYKKNYPPPIDEKTPINLREEGLVGFVREGDLIARYVPGKSSKPGKNVFGEEIPVKPFTPKKVKLGKNVFYDKTIPGLKAATDGFIRLENDKTIDVEPAIVLEQADPRVGELRTAQPVVVLNDVRFGARIISEKDVWVQGVVEDAYIKAKGNVIVLGGVMGDGKGKIIAGNNIYIYSARFQKFFAEKSIYFEEEIVGCEVSCRNKVISHFGRMVGGKATASHGIYINSIGSSEGIQTILRVGVDDSLDLKIEKEKEILNGYLEKVVSIKQEIYDLVLKQMDAGLTPEEENHLKMLKRQNETIPQKLEETRKRVEQLQEEKKRLIKADVVVPGDLFDGVVIEILEDTYEVKKKMRLRRFHNLGGKIRMEVFRKE